MMLARTSGADVRVGVKLRRTRIEHMSADLPPKADIAQRGWHGRKVPQAAVSDRSKSPRLTRSPRRRGQRARAALPGRAFWQP